MDYKYTGIVLSKRNIGETDRMYVIYTLEGGKIRAIARGVRKSQAKLAGHLENFMLADVFVAKNRGTGNITGAIVENDFALTRKNLEALQSAFSIARMIEKFTTWDDPDKKLFLLLQEYFESLEDILSQEKEEKIPLINLGFQFKLFDALGYLLEMDHCVSCGEKIRNEKNHFDAIQGGIICQSCSSQGKPFLPISENAIKSIRLFRKSSLKSLQKLSVQEKDLRNIERVAQDFLKSLD